MGGGCGVGVRSLRLVGHSPHGGRCVPRLWACLLVLVGDRPRRGAGGGGGW